MSVMPRLADVRCQKIRFAPGDRVLVRTVHRLDREQKAHLRNWVQKWAGVDVEVLVYCVCDMQIEVEHFSNLGVDG